MRCRNGFSVFGFSGKGAAIVIVTMTSIIKTQQHHIVVVVYFMRILFFAFLPSLYVFLSIQDVSMHN